MERYDPLDHRQKIKDPVQPAQQNALQVRQNAEQTLLLVVQLIQSMLQYVEIKLKLNNLNGGIDGQNLKRDRESHSDEE